MHFLCKCLIISTFNFCIFLNILGDLLKKAPFAKKEAFLRTHTRLYKERACARLYACRLIQLSAF